MAAIDRVELFASRSRCCEECLTRELANGETESFHRAVFMHKVGRDFQALYDMEMIRKKDGTEVDTCDKQKT